MGRIFEVNIQKSWTVGTDTLKTNILKTQYFNKVLNLSSVP